MQDLTLTCVFLLLAGGLHAADGGGALDNAMPIRVAGPWLVEIGPGVVVADGREVSVAEAVSLEVPRPEIVRVRDECRSGLPVFNPQAAPWTKGTPLRQLRTEECSATGLLAPQSVRVKPGPGSAAPFELDADYALDPFWATLGRIEDGAIGRRQSVFVDYDFTPRVLHAVIVDAGGKVRLVSGTAATAVVLPPEPGAGEAAVANVWLPGPIKALGEENVFPIEFREPRKAADKTSMAERLLPKTLEKLRADGRVTIVAWGDSVTNGGGVDGHEGDWYQNQFAVLLAERFAQSNIHILTAAWGGANSKAYLEAPEGGLHDFVRDVLDPKPDLVTIEFVNDAYLDEEATMAHYGGILERIRAIGAEVVLITPHLVRMDWLKVETEKVDDDPRVYVKTLRRFAEENEVALADASKEWCGLWRQGIPYSTLLANSINHPDVRGHAMFARCLMELFPEE